MPYNLNYPRGAVAGLLPAQARQELQQLRAQLQTELHCCDWHPGWLVLEPAASGDAAQASSIARKHWASLAKPGPEQYHAARDHLLKLFEIGYKDAGSDCAALLAQIEQYTALDHERIGTRHFIDYADALDAAALPTEPESGLLDEDAPAQDRASLAEPPQGTESLARGTPSDAAGCAPASFAAPAGATESAYDLYYLGSGSRQSSGYLREPSMTSFARARPRRTTLDPGSGIFAEIARTQRASQAAASAASSADPEARLLQMRANPPSERLDE